MNCELAMPLTKFLQPEAPWVYVSLLALFRPFLAAESPFSLPVTSPHFPGKKLAHTIVEVQV